MRARPPVVRLRISPHRQIPDTLNLMARMVRSRRDHRTVREMACRIAAVCGPLDDLCRMRAVKGWVGSSMRYEKDPRGADLLRDPVELIEDVGREGSVPGDCDDASLLESVLLESVGIPTRFAAISTRLDRKLHHVAIEARDAEGRWHWLDAFSNISFLPPTTRVMRVNV